MGVGRILLNIVLATLIFVLMYFEEAMLGGIKIGLIWKAGLMALMLPICFRQSVVLSVFVWGGLYTVKTLVYEYSGFEYFVSDLAVAVKFVFFPLLLQAAVNSKASHEKLYSRLVYLSIVLVLTTIPFHLGMEPIVEKESHSLAIYGVEQGYEFAGAFNNKHNAAVTLACCILICLRQLEFSKTLVRKLFYASIIAVALVSLYLTYVRTGFLFLGVSAAYYLLWNRSLRDKVRLIPALIVGFVVLIILFINSTVLQLRLSGANLYHDSDGLASVGSGRFDFWLGAINNWLSDGVYSGLMGIGLEKSKDLMFEQVGMRLFAHNEFLNVLQTNGVIGLILFVGFLLATWSIVTRRRISPFYRLTMSLLIGYFSVLVVQGGTFFWFMVMLASCIAVQYRSVVRYGSTAAAGFSLSGRVA